MTRTAARRATTTASVACAVLLLGVLLSACVSGTAAAPLETTATTPAPDTTTLDDPGEPAPTAGPADPIEVDPERYTTADVPGTSFGVGDGQVNCQFTSDWEFPDRAAWGCAVLSGQAWVWEDTTYAEYCSQFEDFGCRNGLVVRGGDAPTPRRQTDNSFGGQASANILGEGERITVGTVSCTPTAENGVRCDDAAGGHGFELSATTIDSW